LTTCDFTGLSAWRREQPDSAEHAAGRPEDSPLKSLEPTCSTWRELAVKVRRCDAENIAVTTNSKPAKTTAKKTTRAAPARKVASPTTATRNRAAATSVAERKPSAPRRPRPLIALARRSDGRALSFSERLAERRHAQFKHPGPVCHICRMSASRLAAVVPAPGVLAS
jgi:hypothetical protein